MEKEPRKPVFPITPWILLPLLALLYLDLLWVKLNHFDNPLAGIQDIFSSETTLAGRDALINEAGGGKPEESLDSIFLRLVKVEERKKMEANGLACNRGVYSFSCVSNRKVQIDTRMMTVTVPSDQPVQETVIRPYARQEDETLLQRVTPVKILHGNTNNTPPVCQYYHEIPAVIFSSSGFVGNVFHEMNEIIIPLFITTRIFRSQVQFIMVDYNPSFVRKYGNVLSNLTGHEIINQGVYQSVHCFRGAIVGLNFHNHLSVNSSDIPGKFSIRDFREFLRESFSLKYSHVSQIQKPRVMFLSRRTTRRFINEDAIVAMMEEMGFEVVVVARAKVITNIGVFGNLINSCSVFVGAHGAGLTNELFLPDGAVMVQVDLIGLEWAAANYYGNPARAMGVHYLRYKIEPEESSLLKIFGRHDHVAFTDPKGAFPVAAGKEVYLNGQNVRIDVVRFRETMVEAMSLVRDSAL